MNKNSRNFIINQHNNAIFNINQLEHTCANFKVTDEKTKAQFGNFCVALHGYRMVADATEAILINEDVRKGDDGCFYEKIDTTDRAPENSGNDRTPENFGNSSDIDNDKPESHE